MIATMLSDPVFQAGAFGSVVGSLALLLVLRAQVAAHPGAVARGTRVVLVLGILSMLLTSGWSGWQALARQRSTAPTAPPVSASRVTPIPSPTQEPTQEPSPTPTPRLAHSITEVLTAFCQQITARQYVAAWSSFATSLQQRHPRAAVFADWSRYTTCSIADQGGNPEAITVLDFTLAPGQQDQYGFTGDTFLAFTMGIQAQEWKITTVCHQVAEGCFGLEWG